MRAKDSLALAMTRSVSVLLGAYSTLGLLYNTCIRIPMSIFCLEVRPRSSGTGNSNGQRIKSEVRPRSSGIGNRKGQNRKGQRIKLEVRQISSDTGNSKGQRIKLEVRPRSSGTGNRKWNQVRGQAKVIWDRRQEMESS